MSETPTPQRIEDSIGRTTSSRKLAKKARQIYRRDVQRHAREEALRLGNFMKPKPKYVPWKLWLWGMGFFIKIKK